MALSININVNNSDISIKNSKTGAKKNIKSISAGNLNDMTDREFNISQKRKVARKQAMKLISDAWVLRIWSQRKQILLILMLI